jgi:GDP/UDP-N,N'-diacetylbacillosamine 2-epimerase (hydrolysing)
MKVGILTSSRADFGIYLPLVKKLFQDSYFQPEIIAFGTHLSTKFGMTINEIENEGFTVKHKLETLPKDDSSLAISLSISSTTAVFSEFWNSNSFDLVFALGDRYEMMGAVLAGSPFNVTFAHIHAGETTLGAIDNIYRHSISLMSKYLFVTTEEYRNRAIEIIQRPNDVFNVGALSIANLINEKLYSISEFKEKFEIDLNIPTILTTFHPETVGFEKNELYIKELLSALKELSSKYQIVITMPNSDTEGLMIRGKIEEFGSENRNIFLVESFGMRGYLSCMKNCKMLIGNTSSAFVEASFFPKWVINLGSRQKGRIITPNILNSVIEKNEILNSVFNNCEIDLPTNCNVYGDGSAANNIIIQIKKLHGLE